MLVYIYAGLGLVCGGLFYYSLHKLVGVYEEDRKTKAYWIGYNQRMQHDGSNTSTRTYELAAVQAEEYLSKKMWLSIALITLFILTIIFTYQSIAALDYIT